jgi:hypothetical protein
MADVVVRVFVDALSALYADSLEDSVFGFDSRRAFGSQELGGPNVSTAVQGGDRIFWLVVSLECEAFVHLHSIEFENPALVPTPVSVDGVSVFTLTVPTLTSVEPYSLDICVGTSGKTMRHSSGFSIRPAETIHE